MKVLIVGEFSAFAKNLALGINNTPGNEAIVFSYEDGFKKIAQDKHSFTYQPPDNYSLFGKTIKGTHHIKGRLFFYKFQNDIRQFYNYFDAVFIISYTLLREETDHKSPLFSKEDILKVVKDPNKVFMSSCGGDMAYHKFALQDKRLGAVYKDDKILNNELYIRKEAIAQTFVKNTYPMSYQYHEAYRLFGKQFPLGNPIPLPFDSRTVDAKTEYCKNGKITIFNGALRPTKGTIFIEKAIDRIERKYGDRIIVRKDRLPYTQFLKFLQEVDIYLDLCTDYDYGMSAIAAMLAGCVVFSGNEPETRKVMGTDEIPIVSASPDENQIFNELERLVLHPELIEQIGRKSVGYARKYHDCTNIAPLYLQAFK